jgi:hypothetical protein
MLGAGATYYKQNGEILFVLAVILLSRTNSFEIYEYNFSFWDKKLEKIGSDCRYFHTSIKREKNSLSCI